MIVVLTAEAEADLDQITTYIAEQSIEIALNFVQELREKCESLADTPRGYPLVPRHEHLGIRRRAFGNYLIFYRVAPAPSKWCMSSMARATTSDCCFQKRERRIAFPKRANCDPGCGLSRCSRMHGQGLTAMPSL